MGVTDAERMLKRINRQNEPIDIADFAAYLYTVNSDTQIAPDSIEVNPAWIEYYTPSDQVFSEKMTAEIEASMQPVRADIDKEENIPDQDRLRWEIISICPYLSNQDAEILADYLLSM